jgi:hypothetical protein
MDEKFVKLTSAVYKALEFFPESDPLKNRAKDKALAIMSRLGRDPAAAGENSIQEDIDILLGYLWIGKSQGWLSAINYLIISNEYEKIKKEIKPAVELTQKLPGIDEQADLRKSAQIWPKGYPEPVLDDNTGAGKKSAFNLFDMPDRQKKIIEFLTKNEKAQVMDLQAILPDVTKRTIRRDLDELLGAGKIVRLGEFNQVVYKIKQ